MMRIQLANKTGFVLRQPQVPTIPGKISLTLLKNDSRLISLWELFYAETFTSVYPSVRCGLADSLRTRPDVYAGAARCTGAHGRAWRDRSREGCYLNSENGCHRRGAPGR